MFWTFEGPLDAASFKNRYLRLPPSRIGRLCRASDAFFRPNRTFWLPGSPTSFFPGAERTSQ